MFNPNRPRFETGAAPALLPILRDSALRFLRTDYVLSRVIPAKRSASRDRGATVLAAGSRLSRHGSGSPAPGLTLFARGDERALKRSPSRGSSPQNLLCRSGQAQQIRAPVRNDVCLHRRPGPDPGPPVFNPNRPRFETGAAPALLPILRDSALRFLRTDYVLSRVIPAKRSASRDRGATVLAAGSRLSRHGSGSPAPGLTLFARGDERALKRSPSRGSSPT